MSSPVKLLRERRGVVRLIRLSVAVWMLVWALFWLMMWIALR